MSQRRTVLVAGGTGSGKTILIEALARVLPLTEPVLVLDDGEDLHLDGPLRELQHEGVLEDREQALAFAAKRVAALS